MVKTEALFTVTPSLAHIPAYNMEYIVRPAEIIYGMCVCVFDIYIYTHLYTVYTGCTPGLSYFGDGRDSGRCTKRPPYNR
jgi:hypothetical protein